MNSALVISVDFELRWGVRGRSLDGPYRQNLLGVPTSVRETLQLFRDYRIRATWATVGFLFARSREELRAYSPQVRPRYDDASLDPYADAIGQNEREDPFHFAPTLIQEVAATPGQELATHTFSHFYCLEPGRNMAEAFAADLDSVRRIMRDRVGVEPRSIVFPRNQHNPEFDPILLAAGVNCYRGTSSTWMWRPRVHLRQNPLIRAARLADAYVPVGGDHTFSWASVPQENGTFNVPASFFVRPGSWGMKGWRIRRAIRQAARRGRLIHLWWHPHNFGVQTRENLAALDALLQTFAECREMYGMESLTMADVAERSARFHPDLEGVVG